MKKSELKQLIKPIVKECVEESVQEILLESGLLSAVIKEVMKGALPVLTESINQPPVKQQIKQQESIRFNQLLRDLEQDKQDRINEIKKENQEINKSLSMTVGGIDVFKNTKPAPATIQESAGSPLSGVEPNDPGVDISKIFGRKKFNII